MRCDSRNASRRGVALEQLPNNLLAQANDLDLTATVHRSEDVTIDDSSAGSPRILRHFRPRRHRDRPHAAMLPNEVHDAPPAITLLDVDHRERRPLRPPEPA